MPRPVIICFCLQSTAQTTDMQQQPNGRPYRSHLRPACLPCRRRKSRCQSEASSEVCLMCRAHCTDCVYPDGPSGTSGRASDPPRRRRQRSSGGTAPASRVPAPAPAPVPSLTPGPVSGGDDSILGPSASPSNSPAPVDDAPLALASADDQHNLHIVGPAATSDNQVLSEYLSSMPGATRASRLMVSVPGSRSKPVLFTTVQKRPLGVAVNRSPSAEKLRMIEKLLEPFERDVVDLLVHVRGIRG